MRIPFGRIPPPAVAVAAGGAAAAWYGFVLVRRAGMLFARAYDQGFFQAVVWNVAHGHGFTAGFWPRSFLGLHFSPLLALPAGLELLWPDARALSLLHALALGAAAPAAYLLLTALLPDGGPSRVVAAALAAPLPAWLLLQQAAAADFHPEAIALPLLLLAGWAGLTGRTALMIGLALAALAAREDQAYGVLLLGVVLLATGRPRAGAGMAALGAVWAVVVAGVVMPALRGPVTSQVDYYAWLHGASAGAVLAALLRPAGWLQVAAAVAGVAGLPLLRPVWLLGALPPLALDLLSSHDPQPALGFQYGLPLVLPVLVAAAFGARAAIERGWLGAPAGRGWLLALPALALAAAGPAAARGWLPARAEPGALARLAACAAPLPAAAPVAADDDVAPPLASRPLLVMVDDATPATWVVADRRGVLPAYVDRARRAEALARLPDDGRRLLCDDGRFQLWSPAGG